MLEKLTNAAERLANRVAESRRGFLARFGKAALAAAAAVVGLLALPKEAQAGQKNLLCCAYACPGDRGRVAATLCPATSCPTELDVRQCSRRAVLIRQKQVSTCNGGCA
jgi:hypothetical protein